MSAAVQYFEVGESAAAEPSKHIARYSQALDQFIMRSQARLAEEKADRQSTLDQGLRSGDLPPGPAAVVSLDNIRDFYFARNEWDGYITSVDQNKFTAVIYPLGKGKAGKQDLLEAPLNEVSPKDRHLVIKGAIFRLSAGRLVRNGSYSQLTKIYFRRAIEVPGDDDAKYDISALFV